MQEANTMGTAWEGADNIAFVEQINGFTEESFPSISTWPSVGLSKKFRHRTKVLFPAPDIPMIP